MKNKLKDILKSGNFTVYFHDNGCCYVYKGKYKQEQIEDEDFKEEPIFSSGPDGYSTELEGALIEVLGGNN